MLTSSCESFSGIHIYLFILQFINAYSVTIVLCIRIFHGRNVLICNTLKEETKNVYWVGVPK